MEFSRDIYIDSKEIQPKVFVSKDDTLEPAIEIVVQGKPRDIERSTEDILLFKDLRPYLQIGRNFSVVNRLGWSNEAYEYKSEIPEKYNDMYVYGIGMEDNPNMEKSLKDFEYDITLKKRMVIVLSEKPRRDANLCAENCD